jgi:3-phenylpropionate/trans-cinnamate dioxygenase ferredoxin reductase subunit
MLVTYYASGKINFDVLFPYGADKKFFQTYNVKLHLGSPVVKLDALEKVIFNDAGYELSYDQCLVATGAGPLIPPIEGIKNEGVYTVRTVEDAIALKKTLTADNKSVLVVGASMVGIKMVEMYLKNDFTVYFADMADHIFPLSAHENCAIQIENYLIDKGVQLRLGAALNKIEKTTQAFNAYYQNIETPDKVDIIIMCIGVRANLSFIDRNQVDVQAGILVDDYMNTNCEGLYAAGDVAQGRNILSGEKQIIGLWANGRYQGRTAGLSMVDKKEIYRGTVPHNITHFLDIDFVGVGDVKNGDKIFEDFLDDKYCRLVWKNNRLVGINLLNTPEISGILKSYFIKNLENDNSDVLGTLGQDAIMITKLYKIFPELRKIL